MDNKITIKLEELILKAINERKLEEATVLIDLRISVARVKSFEKE